MKKSALITLTFILLCKFHFLSSLAAALYKNNFFEGEFYIRKANEHKKTNINNGDLLLVGDSILHEIGTIKLGNCEVYNLSIPGETSKSLLKRIKGLNINNDSHILIMIGVNDLGVYISPHRVLNNIKEISNYLLPKVKVIYLSTVIRTNGWVRNNSNIEHLNALLIENFISTNKIKIVDSNNLLNSYYSSPWAYTRDGIHLTEAANSYLWSSLVNHLRRMELSC